MERHNLLADMIEESVRQYRRNHESRNQKNHDAKKEAIRLYESLSRRGVIGDDLKVVLRVVDFGLDELVKGYLMQLAKGTHFVYSGNIRRY